MQGELTALVAELYRRRDECPFFRFYPDEDQPGYPARHKYPKHLEFYALGADTFSRMFMSALGVGKTEGALYEVTCHARGWYPHWWEGVRYDRPLNIWVSGASFKTTRDILMRKWLGPTHEEGTGMLPVAWLDKDSITRVTGGGIDNFRIKRADGTYSHVGVRTVEQGVKAYYGTEQDLILLDEPHPADIYVQCVGRTRNRENARILYTVAPFEGRTETVALFMNEPDDSRKIVNCGWDNAPHLTEEWKKNARANVLPYLLETVEKGLPLRGAGAVYPFQESSFVIKPIRIEPHWPLVWGFDGGYKNTAVVWMAWDKDTDTVYVFSEYKAGGVDKATKEPMDYTIHAARILSRNRAFGFEAMPGVGDAADVAQLDGRQMLKQYQNIGCKLELAEKGRGSVHAGIAEVFKRLANGQLKVFDNCVKWLDEFRTYSYEQAEDAAANETSIKVIKGNDHLMDATRYGIHTGLKRAKTKVQEQVLYQQVTF